MNIEASPFSARLWARTKALHLVAERSGFIARMLRGTASRRGYALFMHNLVPGYQALEEGLAAQTGSAGVARLRLPEVFRRQALEADLAALDEPGLFVLPEGEAYAAVVRDAGAGSGERLIAHAYTRTLGDLSGGQILRRLLGETLALGPEALCFYDFPAIADIAAYKSFYRAEIDAAGREIADPEPVLAEAEAAFRLTIALSEAVADVTGLCPDPMEP